MPSFMPDIAAAPSIGSLLAWTPRLSFLPLLVAPVFVLAYVVYYLVLQPLRSPLRVLPGPRPRSLVFGSHFWALRRGPHLAIREWRAQYGDTFKLRGTLGATRLVTLDARALYHVAVASAYKYPKPRRVRESIADKVGRGLVFLEGDQHKQRRRLVQPAFKGSEVEAFGPLFCSEAVKMTAQWDQLITAAQWSGVGAGEKHGEAASATVDIYDCCSKVAFDAISKASFSHEFGRLSSAAEKGAPALVDGEDLSSVAESVRAYFELTSTGFLAQLELAIPSLRMLPTARRRRLREHRDVLYNAIHSLLRAKRAAMEGKSRVRDGEVYDKSLLGLLLKANLGTDGVTDDELAEECATFLVAGHDTVATALSWALYLLAAQPAVQDRLRAELYSCAALADMHSMDSTHLAEVLSAENLPYLDGVIRETLRLYAPVSVTERTCTAPGGDVIPLGRPIKLADGSTADRIRISEGDGVTLALSELNRAETLWGPDADEFRPERWLEPLPEPVQRMLGWGHLSSFLFGPRQCIGYRFALLEVRAILATTIRQYVFAPAAETDQVSCAFDIALRPVVDHEAPAVHDDAEDADDGDDTCSILAGVDAVNRPFCGGPRGDAGGGATKSVALPLSVSRFDPAKLTSSISA